MRLVAIGLALALTISACTSTTCRDNTVAAADVGDCALGELPYVQDAGTDGGTHGRTDDFSDCHLRDDLTTALGGRAPTSPEACNDLCAAAIGVRRTYTLCALTRTPKYAPNSGMPGPQGTWYVSCEFTPAERDCSEKKADLVPTN